jgi:hypothetical protein
MKRKNIWKTIRYIFLLYAVLLIVLSGCNAADTGVPYSEQISETIIADESNNMEDTKNEDISDNKADTASENDNGQVSNEEAATAEVHISITGHKDEGIILADTVVNIDEGYTVIDVLKRTAGLNNIQLECSGIKAMAYVKGIGNTYEFDYGPKSGWIYRVNGKISNIGAGKYKVKDGDSIEWLYTVDFGREFDTESEGAQE